MEMTESKTTTMSAVNQQPNLAMIATNPMHDSRIEMLYETAAKWARSEGVDAGNITSFVLVLISVIEELFTEPHSGSFKKKAVLHVINKVLENEVKWDSPDTKAVVFAIVNTTVPLMIDTLVGIATGKINVGKFFKNCSPCCFPAAPAESTFII